MRIVQHGGCGVLHKQGLLCCYVHTPQDDNSPPVWLQLLQRCAGVSSCQPTLIHGLVPHVVEPLQVCWQHQVVCGLQQQTAKQEQQISLQQATISQLQAQLLEAVQRMDSDG